MNFNVIVGGVIACLIVGILALASCWCHSASPAKVQADVKMQAELESAKKLLEKTMGLEYRRQQFWNVK